MRARGGAAYWQGVEAGQEKARRALLTSLRKLQALALANLKIAAEDTSTTSSEIAIPIHSEVSKALKAFVEHAEKSEQLDRRSTRKAAAK